jgi:hypothetical protein
MPRLKLPDGREILAPDDATPEELDAIANEAAGAASQEPAAPLGAVERAASKAASIGPAPSKATQLDQMMQEPFFQGAASGGVMSVGPQAVEGTRKLITGLARRIYQGALKPTKAVVSRTPGGEKALADTGLREGITVSKGGLHKANELVSDLDAQVSQAISGSRATVPRQAVLRRLADPVAQFRDQVAPLSDLRRIANVGREFKAVTPRDIPVQQAQRMKQGTYRAQAKKYGQQGGAEVEAEKALARGLKEELSTAVPEVAPLNARSSQLIQLRKALDDAGRRAGNRDAIGLTDVIAAGTQPGLLAATLAMRAAPQSLVARGLNRTGQTVDHDALMAALRAMVLSSEQK